MKPADKYKKVVDFPGIKPDPATLVFYTKL